MEREKGVIVRVTGPLVVFRGIEGIKMHEVVRVGELGLIGEVVEIRGEDIYVQVYEETSGIGPGEKVERTGMPLSVELGPGLITTIYDGIQRPLEEIKDEHGNFIQRGVSIPGLNRNKKWHFVPVKKVGEEVEEGDIIGEVQETLAIKHRIMVPVGIKGRIEKIEEGEFKVDDIVCVVSDGSKKYEIDMIQRWPVRKPRPFVRKIPTDEPLVTGTRVIDTFFTITKGGTAAIPGPFGSGKCVTGDTPVLLSDGSLKLMRNIFEENKFKGKRIKNSQEEYTILEDLSLKVFASSKGKFRKCNVRAVYKGKTDRLIEIKTRTGRIAKVTPIHKLPRINSDLSISWEKAKDLKIGDYLAVPRKIDFKGKIQSLPVNRIFSEERIVEREIIDKVSNLIEKLSSKYGSKKELAKKLGVSYDVLIGYFLKKNKPTIDFVEKIFSIAGERFPEIKYIKGRNNSKIVRIPDKFNVMMSVFLGLLLSDGMIKKNSLRFYNNDEKILKLFKNLVFKLFGIKAKRTVANNVKCLIVESCVIVKLLKFFGFPEYKKSRKCFIPEVILRSPDSVISSFLGAYFACDGYFSVEKGEIEYSTASKEMQKGLSYLFLRLGIITRLREKKYKGFKQYYLSISGRDEVEKFFNSCYLKDISKFEKIKEYLSREEKGYTSIDIVPLGSQYISSIYEMAKSPYKELKEEGVEIHNYLAGEHMSKNIFKKFASIVNSPYLIKFASNDLEHIYCDKIVEIKEIAHPCEVYDIEVQDEHNFVGGYFPMIFSNTVVLHQLAKWSDADIIVYIGCGERGNEMTDVLIEFPELEDPRTGRPLMERTVLIANTSNMPVAAREASIYTGITIGEYFRDMGYKVALMADSTSRWAEALREMSGRMEEMPGEEGYPAYLGTRIAEFYERAGKVICYGKDRRIGSLSVIGAVSPPGGDLSDPVVQNTLRVVKVFWSLEDKLAYQRHFPAISWLRSYSLYIDNIKEWSEKNLGEDFVELRAKALEILQKEASLEEIVRLVGIDALSEEDKLILDAAKIIREDFLHQHAFDPDDTYTFFDMQYGMLRIIIKFYNKLRSLIFQGRKLQEFANIELRTKIARMKYTKHNEFKEKFLEIEKEIEELG